MSTIPQLRKDINNLQDKLRAANAKIKDLESRNPEVVTQTVEVPVRAFRTVEVPVEVIRTVEVPVEVVVTREVKVPIEVPVEVIREVTVEVTNPETARELRKARAELTVVQERISELENAPPKVETVEVIKKVRHVVVKEVPVEVIREVEVAVPVVREVIKEIPVEIPGPAQIEYVDRVDIQYRDNPELVRHIEELRARLNASGN
jgi:hypothetical protein